MRGQVTATLDNMERALEQANMSWSDIINLTVYTTDMSGFFEIYEETLHQRVVVEKEARFGGALLQISGFAFPEMKIEIVGLAVSGI
jgi:enamine deaminase RidA (YjgF/YER057c/UK114 family)